MKYLIIDLLYKLFLIKVHRLKKNYKFTREKTRSGAHTKHFETFWCIKDFFASCLCTKASSCAVNESARVPAVMNAGDDPKQIL